MTRLVRLGDVCFVERGSMITQKDTMPGSVPVVAGGTKPTYFHSVSNCPSGAVTISASGANAGFVNYWHQPIWASDCTTVYPRDSSIADSRFVYHQLKSVEGTLLAALRRGAAQPHVYAKDVRELSLTFPKLEEQRRIAEVLDAADALKAKRSRALANLDALIQSIFIDMFGGLGAEGWSSMAAPMAALLVEPLRNGVSPAKAGTVEADVLTLSAITGRGYNPLAVKRSTFVRSHSAGNTVSRDDFLICRGNGNLSLVGRGRFPDRTNSQIAFPDTMIAARCDNGRLGRAYLEMVWNGPHVRRQLESLARTTNGTYKINQTMIESVEIPLPPVELQARFEVAMDSASSIRSRMAKAASDLDVFFASLQHRAFRGEL